MNTNIAHFIETGIPGGAEQVMLDICMYVQKTEPSWTPVVITFNDSWIISKCNDLNLHYLCLPYRYWFKKTALIPVFTLFFAFWLRRHRISLLHTHLFGPVTGCAAAAYIARIPHVGTLHDIYMIQEKPIRIYLIKFASFLRTHLITVSQNMEQFYKSYGSLERIKTIYNGIDTKLYAQNLSADDSDTTSGRPLKVIVVGRLIPIKQVEIIIDVAIRLMAHLPFRLTIIGDGPELPSLKILSKNAPYDVKFLGRQDDIHKFLSDSDIFVQYSITEGLSRSIIEAISCGLPCIVSNVGGNSEIVEHGVNGLLVDPNNDNELYDALLKLLIDHNLRHSFSIKSRLRAKTDFESNSNNSRYVALYHSLLD